MREKTAAILCLGLVSALLTPGCVSPFYGTARLKEGWNVNAGLGIGGFAGWTMSYIDGYYIGPRADVEVGYAFSPSFQTHIRVGGSLGQLARDPGPGGHAAPYAPIADAAIGIQLALPHPQSAPALRMELGLGGFMPSLMFGIGKTEWLTLGCRMYLFPQDLAEFNSPAFAPFVGTRPIRKLSIFATPGAFIPYEGYLPLFSFGVGYKLK